MLYPSRSKKQNKLMGGYGELESLCTADGIYKVKIRNVSDGSS